LSSTLPSKSTLDAQSATGMVIAWKKPNSGRTRCANGPSVRSLAGHLVLPEVDEKVLAGLKFSDALPQHLAVATLARRLADLENASHVLAEPVCFERWAGGVHGAPSVTGLRMPCGGRRGRLSRSSCPGGAGR